MQLIVVLILSFFLLELGLRVVGFKPLELPAVGIQSKPEGCFIPKENKGIVLNPGEFSVSIGELNYQVQHTEDSIRVVSLNQFEDSVVKPIIQLYGCSFTYGMGVNDEETYPWLLQKQFPLFKIENRGVPGYGQVQLLNQLKGNKSAFEGVKVIVLNYLPFHDERNTLNPVYQHKLNIGYQLSKKQNPKLITDFSYPYATLEEESLVLNQLDIEEIENSFFWESSSALFHTLFSWLRESRVDEKQDFEVSKALIKEIKIACEEYDIKLVLTMMSNDQRSSNLMTYCASIGVHVYDVSIDFNNQEMTNYPYDKHPNPKAHGIIADKIAPHFQQLNLK